ncbi:hypothetical protein F0919_13750 [Taibaiella lutea]|uniref:Uncharacterized protein n=1 Tax=Taibaiella lutea TaxID=2608001 RepID=A0A5M6CEI1_9BACT|nr:hypothetical protein [Taibaiella lutea]KAA5533598.1 hypothetical protein F0919_13750 [Taibaiella lutea]
MKTLLKTTLVFSITVGIILSVFPTTLLQAKVKRVSISSAGSDLALNHFHITKVIDERLDTTNVGYITTGASAAFLTANFEDGLTAEFTGFLRENVKQNAGSEALSLHVLNFNLFEKTSFKGAEIGLTTHFALYNKDGEKLFDYVVTDTRNTGMNMAGFAGELMRRVIMNFLMDSDKNLPSLLAMYKNNEPLKVNLYLDKDPEQKNLLPYNPQRPLNPFNFVAAPPSKPATPSGSVTGLRINYQIRNLEGKPEGFIELLPYFDQAKSWILTKENARQVLKYEQIRFKVAAYANNEFLKELQTKTFTLATFHDDIVAYRTKYDAMIKDLQAQMDKETGYGTNTDAVDNWNRKVSFYDAFSKDLNKLD